MRAWTHLHPYRHPRDSLLGLSCLLSLLAAGAWTACARPAEAETVRLLAGAREAIESRVELVLEAQEEILAQSFIFGDDAFSMTSLALLRSAVRRGVSVRLLIDSQWNQIPDGVMAHLRDEGVQIRLYHPFRIHKPRWVTRRMHDKLVIADGRRLIVGGRNIESPYFGFGHQLQRRNYIDLDLEIEGEVAIRARDYFFELWGSDHVEENPAAAFVAERRAAAAELDRHEAWLSQRIAWAQEGQRTEPRRFEVPSVQFLHDPVGKKGKKPGTGHALLGLLDGACESIAVESPYLVPTEALREGLLRAQERGIRVRILTNSLATTDNLLPQAGYVGYRKWFVRHGVELWELAGTESLHSKTAIIDHRLVIVGSFNLDPRSEFLNSEMAVVIDSSELAAELQIVLDRHVAGSWFIGDRGYPLGSKKKYPEASTTKILRLQLLRILAPLIRKQL